MDHGRTKRLLEFFVVGVVFGVTEDVLAVLIATDAELTLDIVGVVVLIAIPFAVCSELIVDHPKFLHFDRLAVRIRSAVYGHGRTHTEEMPGELQDETAPLSYHHYCDFCGVQFETGAVLREHLDRQHPYRRIEWRIHAGELGV